MVITVEEYAKRFPSKGKILSSKTIVRRCIDGFLPSAHRPRKLPGGDWIIEIPDEVQEKKTEPVKIVRSLNTKHFHW